MQTPQQFGPIEVNPGQRVLRVSGAPVAIGGRAFDMLCVLIQRPGELVSKDELLDAVWGRVVVEEGNLHVHVSALRKALGAGVITTVPGRGYRFVPPAGAASSTTPAAPAPVAVAERGPALLGRERDLAALHALLNEARLVTLTGPGGIGKTRLARAALAGRGQHHADGMVLVELAALTDAALIPGAVAAALQLQLATARDPLTALVAATRSLRMLVLLDNAEHLIDGVASVVAALLAGGAGLRLLVTSQMPLKLDHEQVYRLAGLQVPDDSLGPLTAAQALGYGAIALLDQRVRAADRRFVLTDALVSHAIQICRQLDGMALAIELAAARCPLLGLPTVAQRLDERFGMLRAGSRTAPARHQTLQAVMDWSHALLSPGEQQALRRLGVFAGGFALALACQVLADEHTDEWAVVDLLAELVDRSLVSVNDADSPRYLLLETGRAYALAQLAAAGETDMLRNRHAQAMQALAEQVCADFWQLSEADFVARHEPELDNLRAALDWLLQHDATGAVALASGAARLWRCLSLHPEALRRCAQAAALIDAHTPPTLAARLWEAIAQLSGEISSAESRAAAERAVALFETLGDARGLYLSLAHLAFSYRSDTPPAREAFARMGALEDPGWPAAVRLLGAKVQGGLASHTHDVAVARSANERRLALATACGSDRDVFAALGNLADVALIGGDAAQAVQLGRALLARLGRRHRVTRAIALGNLMLALLAADDVPAARETAIAFIELSRALDHMYLGVTADPLALLAALEERYAAATQLAAFADAAYAQDQQLREPNEAQARARCAALLQAHCTSVDLARWRTRGADVGAEAVCQLALQMRAQD